MISYQDNFDYKYLFVFDGVSFSIRIHALDHGQLRTLMLLSIIDHHRFFCSRDCRLLSHRQADVTSPRCCQQAHSTSRTSRLCIREAMPSSSGNALRDSYYCRLSYCSFCSLGNNGLESSQLPAHSDGVHKGSQVRGKHW